MRNKPVTTTGPSGSKRTYDSISATARTLSGNGTTARRMTISRRVASGGGFVGNVYVKSA